MGISTFLLSVSFEHRQYSVPLLLRTAAHTFSVPPHVTDYEGGSDGRPCCDEDDVFCVPRNRDVKKDRTVERDVSHYLFTI
jgi:hypothetical protein